MGSVKILFLYAEKILRLFTQTEKALIDEGSLQELTGQPFIYHEDKYLSNTLRAFLEIASELSSHFPLFP